MALPTTLKTPGVYINETNAFPNSVVGVETSVPAFIGYTEKAEFGGQSLKNKPVRIESFMEFELFFGKGFTTTYNLSLIQEPTEQPKNYDFKLKGKDQDKGKAYSLIPEENKKFNLYNALKFFYQNGGASCFIVSVGMYTDTGKDKPFTSTNQFKKGIDLLKKETEPTMIVVPDAVLFGSEDCYRLQEYMLNHCGEQMDKVAILDIHEGYKGLDDPNDNPIDKFRNQMSSDYLSFGAAYYPWLNTTVTSETEVSFKNLNADAITELKAICKVFMEKLKQEQVKVLKPYVSRLDGGPSKADLTSAKVDIEIRKGHLDAEMTTQKKIISDNDAIIKDENETDANNDIAKTVILEANQKIKENEPKLVAVNLELEEIEKDLAVATKEEEIEAQKKVVSGKNDDVLALTDANTAEEIEVAHKAINDEKENLASLKKELELLPNNLSEGTIHNVLLNSVPDYKLVMESVLKKKNLLAPASAMAGIYSLVDSQRGIWKAPANVAVSAVVSPAVLIDYDAQQDLNVPILGKAICAIRPFIGLGTMVWGARTLDANSFDWRYINVRRTMIMLEQSIKFATKAYVFESNDKNTWVSIESMIENFLTNLWKQGALAGAVPADAFSVNIGLGTTMTATDILEGIMRIEIKVAVSRPAEFIVISFEQQMQKS